MKFWLGLAGCLGVAATGAMLTMEASAPDGTSAPASLPPSAPASAAEVTAAEVTRAEVTEADRAGVPRQMQARAILARQAGDPARPIPKPGARSADEAAQAEARVRRAEAEAAAVRGRLEQEEARAAALAEAAAAATRELAAARAEVEALRAREAEGAEMRGALAAAEEARRVAEGATDARRQALDEERARSEGLAGALAEARRRVAALESAAEAAQAALQAQAASAARERAMMRAGLRRLAVALRAAQVARSEAAARTAELAVERDRAEEGRLAAERTGAETREHLDRLMERKDRGRAAEAPDLPRSPPALAVRTRPGTPQDALAPTGATEAFDEERLLARVAVLLGRGDISGARLFLTLGVRSGSARATALLAETYDPAWLTALRVRGMRGDPERASDLYRQARQGRDPEERRPPGRRPATLAEGGSAAWAAPIRQAGLPGPVPAPAALPPTAPWSGE